MKLELKGNSLTLGDKEIKLTDEQLKGLGVKLNPFDVTDGEEVFYINVLGGVCSVIMDYNSVVDWKKLEKGKYCIDEKLMEQKALRQNLNDLLWKFTNENDWREEVWEDLDICKYHIFYDFKDKRFRITYNFRNKIQGTTYFISEEIAQRAIDEIVKPYMKEHPEFVW